MSRPSWFSSTGVLWVTALGLALVGALVLAVLAPRLFGLDESGWWVTVAVGVLIGAAVVIYGYAQRDTTELEEAPTPED